jgi:hypothetical protein
VKCYTDSDWASNPQDRKSVSGYIAHLGGAAIDWHSKRQPTVAKSSAEAEYVAAAVAGSEIVWLRRFLGDIGHNRHESTALYVDNQSAIAMITGTRGTDERRKHIDVKHHYIKELVENGVINVKWIPSGENIADMFTKALGIKVYVNLRDKMMGCVQPAT